MLRELPAPAAACSALGQLRFPQQRAKRGQLGIWRASRQAKPRKMERPSCSTAPASAVLRGGSVAARCFHLLLLFLKGFVMLCELGVTPASQPYGKGFTAFQTDEQFLGARLQTLRFQDQQTDLGQVPAPRSTLLALLWFSLVWVTKVWRGIS